MLPNAIKRLKGTSIFWFLVFICTTSAIAQTTRVEALLGQLSKANTDTARITIMRKLSTAYTAVDPIKKFYYAQQYLQLAEKNGMDSLVSSAYLDMGISHGMRSNMDSALYFFNLGFKIAKESNYQTGIARSYANIGFAYDRLDRKKEAVKNYEEALKIYRKLNTKKAINQMITNVGSIYFDLGEYKVADGYFQQVLENVKEVPSDQIGLGNALFSLGNSNRKLGNTKKAFEYYRESLAIREKIGDINGIALSNWGIGQLYVNTEDYPKALQHLTVALKNDREIKNVYQECAVLMSMTRAYLGLKDYKKADENGNLALQRAKETGSKGIIAEALKLLVEVNKTQQKYANALKLQSDYIAVNDSLNLTATKKEVIINDLHRINTDNKKLKSDNKTITSKNTDYVIVISLITFLLIIVAILLAMYYKRNLEKKATNIVLQKQKQEIAEVNEELGALNEELTTQMDIVSAQNIELEKLNGIKNKFFSIVSHDLRAPLITLKTLFELYRSGDLTEKELNELLIRLEDTIYSTASFLDNLLEWSKSQLDGVVVKPAKVKIHDIVSDNIRLMDSQITLKSIHVENKIPNEITVFADPNMLNTVVRNLLSNAIKFCTKGDKVIFDAKLAQDKVIFEISDNGPGISDNEKANLFNLVNTTTTGTSGEKGYHIGLILCKDMISQNNGSIELKSKLGEGTTFYITLPATKLV